MRQLSETASTTVKIPKTLSNRIVKAAQKEGYRSVSEFVIDAARRRLDQLS
jgi:metal-responsive CopG/Arc/MetJ family transcriptional regulator